MNPPRCKRCSEYGERFQIEEELLDEKSNGFHLERSELRSAPALSRLCLVMAVATLLLSGRWTAGGRSRQTPLGGCSLAARQ